MLKIEDDNFKIWYEESEYAVFFEGSLRLWDPSEYSSIKQFLLDIHDFGMDCLTIDISNLEFLNSSGINMLCKFVFEMKKVNRTNLLIIGRANILWQKKSLQNLKKLWDKIQLKFVN